MGRLYQIEETVRLRVNEIGSSHPDWPCRKGCDECCRHLASVPLVSSDEWVSIAAAVDGLSSRESVRQRIRASAEVRRPVVCPLLDSETGTCLVYEVRPVVCRAYGFYAERDRMLGCSRIAAVGEEFPDIVWGNQAALEARLFELGEPRELWRWVEEISP